MWWICPPTSLNDDLLNDREIQVKYNEAVNLAFQNVLAAPLLEWTHQGLFLQEKSLELRKRNGGPAILAQGSSSPCLLTQGEVPCCVVALSRSRRLSFLGAGVVFAALVLELWSGMGSDGYQTQRRVSWIPGKERAEKVVLTADITIDGGKE